MNLFILCKFEPVFIASEVPEVEPVFRSAVSFTCRRPFPCQRIDCEHHRFLAAFQPENIWIIGSCVALDQFGYGFGFTAYMLYLIYFSEGEFKTAHYSLCTAFMAMSLMLPGMVAGYIQEAIGYVHFFGFVMICCLVTVLVTFLLKVDPEYGKK